MITTGEFKDHLENPCEKKREEEKEKEKEKRKLGRQRDKCLEQELGLIKEDKRVDLNESNGETWLPMIGDTALDDD